MSNLTNLCTLLLLCVVSVAFGQNDFQVNGNAQSLGNGCYRLTSNATFVVGSIWNEQKIDLTKPFDVISEVSLGCNDANGADGMVFGFQPLSTSVGVAGGSLGIGGVVPSLGIEMDTWQNVDFNDPPQDHIAIVRDGNLNHVNSLAGPVSCAANGANIENCAKHDFRVSWEPSTLTLEVWFDCSLRLSLENYDIVNEIFNGNPWVYWGFMAATGGSTNIHEVCLGYTTFLDAMPDVTLCAGETATLNAATAESYAWEPSTGLSDATIQNPELVATATTEYMVTMTDNCGFEFHDTVLAVVQAIPVIPTLPADTTLCTDEGPITLDATTPDALTYAWSSGDFTPTATLTESGTYTVTVANQLCNTTASSTVTFLSADVLSLGPDIESCIGSPITFSITPQPSTTVLWPDGSTGNTFEVEESQLVIVTLTDECGTVQDSAMATLNDCGRVFIPNSFTPNGDGINDYFGVCYSVSIVEVVLLRVYDRWGEFLFEMANYQPSVSMPFEWDGTYRGKLLDADTYMYYTIVRLTDNSTRQISGNVSILK